MEIRLANKYDDKKQLAKLLYYVDPYIYPYWFNSCQEGENTLVKLLEDENSIFYYKNCIIVKDGNEYVGVFSFIPANAQLSLDYSKYDVNFQSHHVIANYVIDIINNLIPDDVCVVGLYVAPSHRRRGIATKMFEFLFKHIPCKTVSLEVLEDNIPAKKLYKTLDFKITKTYKGYNGYKKRKPICHVMSKTIKK